jgi:ribosomal protein L11 methyltransferase
MEEALIYIEYRFIVEPLQPATDILIAELGEAGFESFVEEENGVLAYIQKQDWHEEILSHVSVMDNSNFTLQYTVKEIAQENWNATWESNFSPILVDDRCRVRAPFHSSIPVEYDIVIEPKMSFGTGHHETTHMMLQHLLSLKLEGASVLDMGSGTGVLAILSAMMGAGLVHAIDIDHWCFLNAEENIQRNNVGHIVVMEGDASLLGDRAYDVIIANINRNILLADIPIYAQNLKDNGILLLSGFYMEDLALINEKCLECCLKFEKKLVKNNWVASKYVF